MTRRARGDASPRWCARCGPGRGALSVLRSHQIGWTPKPDGGCEPAQPGVALSDLRRERRNAYESRANDLGERANHGLRLCLSEVALAQADVALGQAAQVNS